MDGVNACASASHASAVECLSLLTKLSPSAVDCERIIETLSGVNEVITKIQALIPHGNEDTMVAVLDRDWKAVEKVYINQVAVKEALAMTSKGAVSTALKNGTTCRGRRLKKWMDLDDDLKKEYLSRDCLPAPVSRGISIYSFDEHTGEMVNAFPSISHAVSAMRLAKETLQRACDTGTPYQGLRWSLTPPGAAP